MCMGKLLSCSSSLAMHVIAAVPRHSAVLQAMSACCCVCVQEPPGSGQRQARASRLDPTPPHPAVPDFVQVQRPLSAWLYACSQEVA